VREIRMPGFDAAGAGTVTMRAGLRPMAKALDIMPPDSKVYAPALDPTDEAGAGTVTMRAGLRPMAKALDMPPDSKVYAPALDPTG
jgi:hypothetical protein